MLAKYTHQARKYSIYHTNIKLNITLFSRPTGSFNIQYLNRFGVTEELIKPFLEGMTMRQAMKENKLFIIDLAILEGCPAITEKYVVSDSNYI